MGIGRSSYEYWFDKCSITDDAPVIWKLWKFPTSTKENTELRNTSTQKFLSILRYCFIWPNLMYDPTCNSAIIVIYSQQKNKAIQRWYPMSVVSLLRHLPQPIFIAAKQEKMYISSRIDSAPWGNLASHETSTHHTPLPDSLTHNLNSRKAFAW